MPKLVADSLTSTEFKTMRTQGAGNRPRIQISCKNVSVTVGTSEKNRKLALQGVDCKFGSAQLTALMGPSGAGKTTLLNVLTGVGSPEGQVKARRGLQLAWVRSCRTTVNNGEICSRVEEQ